MSNKTKSCNDKMTGSAKILAINFSFMVLIALFVISASTMAFGDVNIQSHTSQATVVPDIVKGGINYVFVADVHNNGPDSVSEFRVYNNTAEQNPGGNTPFTNLVCYPAAGWNGPFYIPGTPTDFCQYTAKNTSQYILAGQNKIFTFSFDTPTEDSTRTINLETRDPKQFYTPLPVDISVDATAPTTDKHFEGPQIVVDGVEWIDGVSTVVLNATDSIGPHDTGVNKTEYRDTLVNNNFCYQPATCGNAEGSGNFKTYAGPFSLNSSCHLLEYRSIDGVGNVETAKKNCFFVDKTNPIAGITVGNPKLECSKDDTSRCAYWVQDHVTQINVSCSNGIEEPHPSPLDKLQWRIGIDTPPTGAWNEVNANQVATVVFNEDSIHYLEYTCNDTVGKHDSVKSTVFRVDSVPPQITKTMFGKWLGDCPPEPGSNDECFVANNGQSGVNISVVDPDPTGKGCNVDKITCQYRIDWIHNDITKTVEQGEFSDKKEIIFTEDSTHKLYINCSDALGNKVSDVETFLVDSTPPVTNKTYGLPFVNWWYPKNCNIDGPVGVGAQTNQILCGMADWINSSTPVTLSASDNKVGVNKTYWRNLLVNNADAGEKICGFPEQFCNPDNYNKYVNLSTPWNEYSNPFQKPEESCHVIQYYSTDLLGNTETVKSQCVFVDNTAPDAKKTIGEPKIIKNETCSPSNNGPAFAAASKPRVGDVFKGLLSISGVGSGPCANATQPNQCAYVNVSGLTNYAKDTIKAQLNISLDTIPPGCENVLILSSGNPLNNGNTLSTNMGHAGCGTNPDGFATNDCVQINYTIPADVSILAVSSEWPEYYHTTFTDWMQVSNSISVDMSINNWKNVIELPQYGPDKSGTQTLASNVSKGSAVSLRVADSGDSIYDTAMILLPLACGEPVGPAEKCGDGILQEFLGEECDLGAENGQPGSTCSANCEIVEPPENCTGGDTYITQDTPITITCKDALPHPVDHVSLWYRYRVSDDCTNWGEWTDWTDPVNDNLDYVLEKNLTFPEDSCHELEYYCKDGLGNTGSVQSEIDIVDTEAPEITKEIVGPSHFNSSEEKMYIDGVTEIHVDATDPEPHPVNDVTCDWDYEVIGGDKIGNGETGVTPPFIVHFPEESKHVLTIECRDALNNTATDTQTYYVDKTAPVTNKTYGKPFFTDGTSDWISSATDITFAVEDAGPHKSGINATKYRITLLDDNNYCRDADACQQAEGTGDWETYEGPFNIDEDSCHLIEYYSVDNVNKTETVKKQCTFVENQQPLVNKTVGDPKEMWDGKDAHFYNISGKCWNGQNDSIDCWKITTLTPITLDCTSNSSHPVGDTLLAFNVNFDGSDMTEEQCSQTGGNYNQSGDGFCIVGDVPATIYFNQTSEHNLQAYCTDAFLNKGPIDEEKFKVEGTSFNITINKKWNLISVPFVLLNDSMHKVFDPQADKIMSVWTYDAFAKKWFVFTPDGVDNDDMASMLPGWGYWVLAGNDTSLLIGGSLFTPAKTPPTKEIVSGWNLIGYWGTNGLTGYYGPKGNGTDAYCELYSLGGNLLDKEFNSLWSYWEPYNPNEWIQFNKYNKLDPGAGYWLHTTQSGEYVVPTDCSVGPWH